MKAKVIKTEAEYEAALEYIETLMDASPGSPEESDLDLFSLLVDVYENEHHPIHYPDPVDAIKFRMDQEGLSRKDMARYLGSASRVSDVLNGKRSLSLSMIRSLNSKLGIPADVLLQEPGKQLSPCKYNINDFPFNAMFKQQYFEAYTGTLHQAKEFFEELLGSLLDILGDDKQDYIYCRKNKESVNQYALKAWQARAMHLAKKQKLLVYQKEKIDKNFLKEVVRLSQFKDGPRLAGEFLNKAGIHFVILPHLEKTYLDGACFSMPDGKPVITLTLRHDRLDNFWYTLMHELAHLVLHLNTNKTKAFFDDTETASNTATQYEKEADKLAREVLISRTMWQSIQQDLRKGASDTTIVALANEHRISPAIIAGRLRWEKRNYILHSKLIGNKGVKKIFSTP